MHHDRAVCMQELTAGSRGAPQAASAMPAWPSAVMLQAALGAAALSVCHSFLMLHQMPCLCMGQLDTIAAAVLQLRMLCCRCELHLQRQAAH